jgi:hypothetical protein
MAVTADTTDVVGGVGRVAYDAAMRSVISSPWPVFVVVAAALAALPACDPPEVISEGREGEGEGGEGEEGEGEAGCDVDGDCRGGEVCEDDVCVRVCDVDGDCNGGELCRADRCVRPDCVVDGDCPGGFFCDDDNACVAFDSCVDGDVRCVDDNTVGTCTNGREVASDCEAGALCLLGTCIPVGEGEGEGEGGEGEGEGEGEVCVEGCLDSETERLCFLGTPLDQACAADQVCDNGTGRCVDIDGCIPECGNRVCGPDPLCGESCGPCTDTCTVDGRCVREPPNPNSARIEVVITPADDGFHPWLSRRTSGNFCDPVDSCGFRNCEDGATLRPNWDGDRNSTLGDPVYTRSTGTIDVLTPSSAQSYRVAVQRPTSFTGGANVTLNIAVDGVNVFGATKRLNSGELWTGITIAWNGTTANITRNDVVQAGFSCGGEGCDGGGDCAEGFNCTLTTFNGQTTGVCNECDAQNVCGAGEECRGAFCIDDTTDRGPGGSCVVDVDCADNIGCVGDGICGEACTLICVLFPDACCTQGGTCTAQGVCL